MVMRTLIALLLIGLTLPLAAQEICDNGVDDDGDGLADLNDPDCDCLPPSASTLRADFEDISCCPQGPAGISCLDDGWVAAYPGSTIELLNTCGYTGGIFPTPPQPYPSGEGALGFYASFDGGGVNEPIARCLDCPMVSGQRYDYDIFVGFPIAFLNPRPQVELTLYGFSDCSIVPTAPVGTTCLTDAGWVPLETFIVLRQAFSWVAATGSFVANDDYEALAIGASCAQATDGVGNNYVFIDDFRMTGPFSGVNCGAVLTNITARLDGSDCQGYTLVGSAPGAATFQWYRDGLALPGATSATFPLDPALPGDYQLSATESNGSCLLSAVVPFVAVPDDLTVTPNIIPPSCPGDSDGSINVSATSSAGNARYRWDNGSQSPLQSNLPAGTYFLTTTDGAGCSRIDTFTLADPTPLSLSTTVVQPVPGGTTGSASATASGGTPPYSFFWSGGRIGAAQNNLPVGTYTVQVTDANGCRTTATVRIDPAPLLEICDNGVDDDGDGLIDLNDPDCACTGTGSATADVIGTACGGYTLRGTSTVVNATYQWFRDGVAIVGATTVDFPLAPALPGGYQLRATDPADNCVVSAASSFVPTPDDLSVTPTVVDPACPGRNDGSISLVATSSSGGVTYRWDDGTDGAGRTDLPAGTYRVTVTDAGGCERVESFTLTDPAPVDVTTTVVQPASATGTGSAGVTATGGTGSYTFAWSDGATGADRTALSPGDYTVTVTDGNGCAATADVAIRAPLNVRSTAAAETCPAACDGIVSLTVVGGRPPYSYAWTPANAGDTLRGLCPGTYAFTVTDAEGRTINDEAVVAPVDSFRIDTLLTQNLCFGDSSGRIEITPDGAGFVQADWGSGATGLVRENLAAGDYAITLTNARGCAQQYLFTVSQPATPLSNALTTSDPNCRADDGSISLSPAGGTPPYAFAWPEGQSTAERGDLAAGNYPFTITDAAGCILNDTATLQSASALQVDRSIEQPTCATAANGRIDLQISGGTTPYAFAWSTGADGPTVTGLPAGTYDVAVTDGEGCETRRSYTLTATSELTVQTDVEDATCFGGNDGAIRPTATATLLPLTYAWSNGTTEPALTGLTTGDYGLTVTDAAGCPYEFSYAIGQPDTFTVATTVVDNVCAGGTDGSISLTPTPAGAYDVRWTGGATGETLTGLAAGSYGATITNAAGCAQTYGFTVGEAIPLVVDRAITAPACAGETGRVIFTPSGGSPPYSIGGAVGDTSLTVELPAGLFDYVITDANGCSVAGEVELIDPALLTASVTGTVDPDFGVSNGSATATAAGGSGGYAFAWPDGRTGATVNGLGPGSYVVTVTDANGCAAIATATLVESAELRVLRVNTDNICADDCGGTAQLRILGGSPPYAVRWSDGSEAENRTDLCDGSYQATVTDAAGQAAVTQPFTVGSPGPLRVEERVSGVSCRDTSDGRIELTIGGGTPPYRYRWDGVAGDSSLAGLTAGTYVVEITDANGCGFDAAFTVPNYDPATFTAEAVPANCNYDAYRLVVLGNDLSRVDWLLNETQIGLPATGIIEGLTPGNYRLAYREESGCTVPVQSFVLTDEPPFTLGMDETERRVRYGERLRLELSSSPGGQVLERGEVTWFLRDSFDCLTDTLLNCAAIELNPTESQFVEVEYRDEAGCPTRFRVPIVVAEPDHLYVPNAFSPNGDNVNDVFTLFPTDFVTGIASVRVYDRWGGLVFGAEDLPGGETPLWDGTIDGRAAEVGVYVYVVRLRLVTGREEVRRGEVVLLR